MDRPVIYFQFDHDTFFKEHTYSDCALDFEKDGFGPVAYTQQQLQEECKKYLENRGKLNSPYKERSDAAFTKIRDGNCCERIYTNMTKHIEYNYPRA
jgi:CDP-glycerol glycerophosphotransferase (TagB/SpsB family)